MQQVSTNGKLNKAQPKDPPSDKISREGVPKLKITIILPCHSERSEESTLLVSRRKDASFRSEWQSDMPVRVLTLIYAAFIQCDMSESSSEHKKKNLFTTDRNPKPDARLHFPITHKAGYRFAIHNCRLKFSSKSISSAPDNRQFHQHLIIYSSNEYPN